jgi:hypothetical protein
VSFKNGGPSAHALGLVEYVKDVLTLSDERLVGDVSQIASAIQKTLSPLLLGFVTLLIVEPLGIYECH